MIAVGTPNHGKSSSGLAMGIGWGQGNELYVLDKLILCLYALFLLIVGLVRVFQVVDGFVGGQAIARFGIE